MSEYGTSDTTDDSGQPSRKSNPLKFMNKTKKVFAAGISKITLSDTTKALEIVTEQINKAMVRFETLESSVKNQETMVSQVIKDTNEGPQGVELKLLQSSHSMLLEMENIGKHVETVLREERIKGFKDSFHQSMLTLTSCAWFALIAAAPVDFFMKAFIIAITVLCIKIVGEKYMSIKQIAEGKQKTYYPKFSQELLMSLSETLKRTSEIGSETVSRTVIRRESLSDGKRQRVTSIVVEEVEEVEKVEAKDTKKKKKKIAERFIFDPELDVIEDETIDRERELGMSFNFLQGTGISFELTFKELEEEEKKSFLDFKKSFKIAYDNCTLINKSETHDVPDDFNLLRFLQADKYKAGPATKRLLETIEFRQKSRVIFYPKTVPRDMGIYRSLRPRANLGHDKLGRMVIVENCGKFFGSKLVPKGLSNDSWIKCYAYENQEFFYEFRKASIRQGKPMHRFVFIADIRKCKLSNIRKLGIINTLKAIEIYIPEIVGAIYAINAPSFAPSGWKMVSKLLDPVLASKIKILSMKEQSRVLIEDLGEEVVPTSLGGGNEIELP